MATDSNGQPLTHGDVVIIRAKVDTINSDVLHLLTLEPTLAYPEGTRVNLEGSQVERVTEEEEPLKTEQVGELPDLEALSKAEIIQYAADVLHFDVNQKLNKPEMIEAVKNYATNLKEGNEASA